MVDISCFSATQSHLGVLAMEDFTFRTRLRAAIRRQWCGTRRPDACHGRRNVGFTVDDGAALYGPDRRRQVPCDERLHSRADGLVSVAVVPLRCTYRFPAVSRSPIVAFRRFSSVGDRVTDLARTHRTQGPPCSTGQYGPDKTAITNTLFGDDITRW